MEDYEWSRWAQLHGYGIFYEPRAAVEHTHQEWYGFFSYVARILRFQLAQMEIDGQFAFLTRLLRQLTYIYEDDTNTRDTFAADKAATMSKEETPVSVGDNEERKNTPGVITLGLTRTIDQIPDKQPCEFCEGQATKTHVLYTLPYTSEGESFIAKADVPGYSCLTCGVDSYDLQCSIEVLDRARTVVREARDETVLEAIEASHKAGEQHFLNFS